MSLHVIHVVFITLSAVLSVLVADWAFERYGVEGSASYAVTALAAIVCSVALTVYGIRFRRKTRYW